ncbi:DUF6282 family protein [Desulfosporosinus sp. Sb-LF]|uniref:DUF6282 family protein n=1 Tax=Desulfosporosinus sp. Sb-LF TaxID=2560027 RepID=UPI00107F396D|nr:DUF6282 family protein [Desulfosporosinus sp. Sb-LF]TGE34342.1 hypothetical protein E4K68_01180 [Desulfosporosinus sp. Sb-LF]
MSKSKQIAEWKEKKFGRMITEEELIKRAHPAWPYLYFTPGEYIKPEVIDRVMAGSIELHTHGAPTAWLEGRSNYYDTAISCSEQKMKAVVFKDQDTPTNMMAGVLQRSLDALAADKAKRGEEFTPVQVFGGIVLDKSIGGMNLQAVKKALSIGRCKEIWLPANDSAHLQEVFGDETKGYRVSDMSGTLTPEMIGVLEILHDYNTNSTGERCCLATCHVSNEEKYDVSKYVKQRGMNVGVVHDHITQELTLNSVEEALELIDLGSYVEICSNSVVPWSAMTNWIVAYDYTIELTKRLIKERGPEHILLVTDAGLPGYDEVPALRVLIETLLKNGISEADLNVMCKDAPAALIGKI